MAGNDFRASETKSSNFYLKDQNNLEILCFVQERGEGVKGTLNSHKSGSHLTSAFYVPGTVLSTLLYYPV